MRGSDISQPTLFVTRTVDQFVPQNHPIRALRKLVDEALKDLNNLFNTIYSDNGRDSIPPERLIRASLLQVLYTIRSERQLVEQIEYNLLFRWFVGLEMQDKVWNHSTFSKNRDRLLKHEVFTHFFGSVLSMAKQRDLLSSEHFSVDGTLVDAWASQESFQRRDIKDDDDQGRAGRDFHGEKRSNATHVSRTDPDAELMRKSSGTASRLSYGVHNLIENRNGLVVGVATTSSASTTEREAAIDLLAEQPGEHRKTLAADKGYDTFDFIQGCRGLNITPHVAQNENRRGGSRIDERTTRHSGYYLSMIRRRLIEGTFGWAKQYGGLRRLMVRGKNKVSGQVTFIMAAYNLLRMRNLERNMAL